MPLNQGTLISSPIRPLSPGMTIATALSNEILGGLHSVQTLSDRDLITTDRRQFGMLVYIINDDDFYQLKQVSSPDISDNLNWDLINISGVASTTEWLDSVISISGTPPGSPTLGDRYLVSSGTGIWTPFNNFIVEWDGSNWNPTIPTEGTTIRVDDDSDAIFSFIQGVWTRYEFVKEPWTLRYDVPLGLTLSVSTGSQYLIWGDLNVDGGIDSWGNITILNGQLTGSGSVATFSFGTLQQIELLTEIIGATGITVSTGSLGERIVSTNLIAGTGISFSYGPGTEIEINSVFPTFPGGRPKYIIEAVETVTVPDNELYYIYGDLEVRGTLDIGTAGKVVVTNGALIAASGSTINNIGNVEVYNLLTTADDGIKIDISQITFGKEGRILFESELKYVPILGATARVVTESDDLVYSTSSAYLTSTVSTLFDRYMGLSTDDPQKKLHINGSGILIDGNESEQDLSLGDPNWARFVIDSGNSDTHTLMDLRNDEGRVLYVNGDIDGGFRFPSVSIGKTPSNTLFNVSDYYGNDYFSIGSTGGAKITIDNDNSINNFLVWDNSDRSIKYKNDVILGGMQAQGTPANLNKTAHGLNTSRLCDGSIQIMSEIYDDDNAYNPATGIWTCPSNGRYNISFFATYMKNSGDGFFSSGFEGSFKAGITSPTGCDYYCANSFTLNNISKHVSISGQAIGLQLTAGAQLCLKVINLTDFDYTSTAGDLVRMSIERIR